MNTILFLSNVGIIVLLLWVLILSHRKRTFFANISQTGEAEKLFILHVHELTTLITTMQFYTDMLLKQEFGKLRISQLELIHKNQESLRRSADLCRILHDPFTYTNMKAVSNMQKESVTE